MGSIDFETIRALNPIDEFCASRGIRLRRSGSLGESVGLCPFHREETGSFTVYPDGHAHCFGCGRHHRDVIDLCADLDGLELREAARKLSDLRTFSSGRVTKPTERQRETNSQPYILTDADIKRMAAGARRLAEDDALIKRLVTKRPEWTADAVHQVARDGDLGIEDGKMLFNYRYGIKARWKDENGNRVIRWLCGGANGECWRQSLLTPSHRVVYLSEGETDALTLLSFGIERPGESLVVALAGASMLPRPEPFAGRDTVIVPDPDEAGIKAERKLRALLEPVAHTVVTIQL